MIVYGMNVSADGYVMDASGAFDWSTPGDDVFAWYIDVQRSSALDVYGRRLWETMTYWTVPPEGSSEAELEYARAWQATPRVVVSSSLTEVEGARLVRSPAEIEHVEGPMMIGGPALAASMIDRIDEFRPVVFPVAVGGGVPFFPAGARLDLELVEERRFDSGPVLLGYRRRTRPG